MSVPSVCYICNGNNYLKLLKMKQPKGLVRVHATISPELHEKAKRDSKAMFNGVENVSGYIRALIQTHKSKK